jgi:hypothetical protein
VSGGEHMTAQELLGPYALGQLAGHEANWLLAHLTRCEGCLSEYEGVAHAAGALGAIPAERRLAMADRLDAADEEDVETVEVPASRVRWGRPRRGLPRLGRATSWLAAAAAVATAFAVGSALGSPDGPPDRPPVASASPSPSASPVRPSVPPREQVPVDAADAGVTARASLVSHTWGTEVTLRATGLEEGATYWARIGRADGSEQPAGTFVGTGSATLTCNLNGAVRRTQATSFAVYDADGRTVLTADL